MIPTTANKLEKGQRYFDMGYGSLIVESIQETAGGEMRIETNKGRRYVKANQSCLSHERGAVEWALPPTVNCATASGSMKTIKGEINGPSTEGTHST